MVERVVEEPRIFATVDASSQDKVAKLRSRAESAGFAWAKSCAVEIQREGRVVSGGWPGTVSEAKARANECLRDAPTRELSSQEMTELARLVYAAARRCWLAVAVRSADE